jgi:hypothetical protein
MILMKKISDGGKTVYVVFICTISVQKPVAEIGVGGRSYAPPPPYFQTELGVFHLKTT